MAWSSSGIWVLILRSMIIDPFASYPIVVPGTEVMSSYEYDRLMVIYRCFKYGSTSSMISSTEYRGVVSN